MIARDYKETLNYSHPMAAARLVRRDRFAWPGGYAMALLTGDGVALCPACVAANWSSVAWSNRTRCNDGWRPAAVLVECNTDEQITCDHCNAVIFEGHNDE